MSVILPINWRQLETAAVEHHFNLIRKSDTKLYSLTSFQEDFGKNLSFAEVFELLSSKIRLTVAEFSEQKIFLHAGVIGLKDGAVLIPGKSYAGKTTLVAEFAKQGFLYFSDEYALLDKKGFVYPFPKKLSMRGIIDDYKQLDFAVEQLGGRSAVKPLPVRFILLTEYKKGAAAKLSETTPGEGIMKSIENSISIRQNPRLVLEVLNNVAKQSRVLKGTRGEASDFIKVFVEYINDLQVETDV